MRSLLLVLSLSVSCAAGFADAVKEPIVLKANNRVFKNTAIVAKYRKEHPGTRNYFLQRSIDPEADEPDFAAKQVATIECLTTKSKQRSLSTGAQIDEIVSETELKVSVKTHVQTHRKKTDEEKRDEVNANVEQRQRGMRILNATGDPGFLSAAASGTTDGDDVYESSVETRTYLLKGFHTGNLKVGQTIGFDGLFETSELEDGTKVIQPYRP